MKPKASKNEAQYIVKILCIGDSGVGKTNILTRFCDNEFTLNYAATIGVDFKVKNVIVNGKKIKLQIWDTAGQERFKNINQSYYRGAIGVLLVYSINDKTSFTNIENWMKQIHENSNSKIIKFLVANKTDLETDRKVTLQQGSKTAQRYGMEFMEVSAKSGSNIQELFKELTEKVDNSITLFDEQLKNLNQRASLTKNQVTTDNRSGCKC